jgi:serine/threonine protein kinase
MELLEGGTLEERVKEYRGDIVRSLHLFCAICDGIIPAHELTPRIIHRDLKPGNVLFRTRDDDTPVVTDFGLCWMDDGERFTASQERVGAFRYMAPELEDGRLDKPRERCDIYSLGKLLYYIVSGGVQFNREKHREPEYDLCRRLSRDSADPLRDAQLEYVSQLLGRMITYDPDKRYGRVRQVRALARRVRSLVRSGHYPFSDHMPCKFCGEGNYPRRPPTDFPVLSSSIFPPSLDDYPVTVFRCGRCGHIQLFDYRTLGKHDPERAGQ